jgi:hypothetical protein
MSHKDDTDHKNGQSGQHNNGVGYQKPPTHTRFQPGQSGNPKGRPKASKNLSTLLKQELNSPIVIEQHGKKRKVARKAALVKSLVNDALKGKDRPRERVFEYVERMETMEDAEIGDAVSQQDEAIIERFLRRRETKRP